MKAENLKEILYAFMDPSVIVSEAVRLKVVQRERVLDPVLLLISLFLVGGTAEAARLASVLRTYVELGGKTVARSVGNRWFDKELLALVLRTKERGLAYAVGLPRHLPGVLAGRTDWIVFDSTTVKLDDRLIDTWQGTGEYAALKVHVELSLGLEGPVAWHISPAREHDSPHLEINEGRRGTGLIVDLGYVSHRRFEECVAHDVHIVARLKEGWNVRLDEDAFKDQGEMWSGSEDFLRLFNGQPVADRPDEELDIDVLLGPVGKETKLRLVQVATPEGFRALLTNVPRKTHDRQAIAFLYRLRWSVEIHNKLAKTCCQLDEISSLKPDNVLTLVHASMIASLIATLICHVEHAERGAVRNRVVRMTKGPLHPMLVWKVISQSSLARHIRDGCSGPEWEQYVKGLVRMSEDPNWRAKPSAIDDAKGRNAEGRAWWKSRPKKAKAPGGKAPAKRSTAVKHELSQTNG